jgi:4a-hydroxytetrahydrobiopterin dehydratase
MRPGSSGASGSRTSARRSLSSRAAELAEAEGHHPDIGFGWGYATVSLRTKKIKGLHENDFIMAAKLDRLASGGAEGAAARQEG